MRELDKDILDQLARPTRPDAVEWKVEAVSPPRSQKGEGFSRGLVVPYIDAREVMARLDEVVGAGGWSDRYTPLVLGQGHFAVQCHLSVCGVTKEDVGEGDSLKAAFSDALKRAAVKFGVGRFLYHIPKVTGMPLEGSDKRAYLSREGEAALKKATARYLETGQWSFNPWTWKPGPDGPDGAGGERPARPAQASKPAPAKPQAQAPAQPQAQGSGSDELGALKQRLRALEAQGVSLPANWDKVSSAETLRRLLARFEPKAA